MDGMQLTAHEELQELMDEVEEGKFGKDDDFDTDGFNDRLFDIAAKF